MGSTYYEFTEVRPNVYRIHSPENVFLDLFIGKEKALLFDTGYGFDDLPAAIREKTDLPLIVVNSHGHPDHVCGNFRFTGDIYIHEKDMDGCRWFSNFDNRKEAVKGAKQTEDYSTKELRNILPKNFDEEYYVNQGAGNLLPVKEGDVFELGGITLKVYEFPGHSMGSIGLYYQEEKLLYFADAINNFLWLFLPGGGNLDTYLNSLYKARKMDFNGFYWGHSPIQGTGQTLEEFIECAENLDYDNGIPYEAPIAQIYPSRICSRKGYGPFDFDRPGYCAIVISKDRL
jgi:glyoxylase-like metal-dependent hydrolase (beta-lactamase superfamily II)